MCYTMTKYAILVIREKYMAISFTDQEKHYHSDEVHIHELLAANGPPPICGMKVAADMVRALFLQSITVRRSVRIIILCYR